MAEQKITLIGAGLAGSLLAVYLAKRGYRVEVFESRPDMRRVDISAGRSINLALSTRGIHALDEVGMKEKIMTMAIPMRGRMMHSRNGKISFHRYGRDDTEVINSISRGGLNEKLMDEAEAFGTEIFFGQRCLGMDFRGNTISLYDEATGKIRTHDVEVVIGTDGAASPIRNDMRKIGRFNFSRDPLEHGYKELTIPPADDGGFRLDDSNALHIWPRGSYMLIALPNKDGSFTVTLFFPHQGELSFDTLKTEQDVQVFFGREFPDAVPLMPTLLSDFFDNPTGNLATVRCKPWNFGGKTCLLGDAAHAVVPFFGQGMNCAFEDCTVLNECIDDENDWEAIFSKFSEVRNANANAIADMALANYFEMRDHVADPKFLLKKDVEFALEERFPDRFIPRYTMVSFRRIPYAVAQSRGDIQEGILKELCAVITSPEELDWGKATSLIETRLVPV